MDAVVHLIASEIIRMLIAIAHIAFILWTWVGVDYRFTEKWMVDETGHKNFHHGDY